MPDLHDPADGAAAYDRAEILMFVAALAPGFTRDEPAFRVAAVLVASLLECGPDPKAIAEVLGYEESWVRTVGGRLRLCGVWRGEEVAVEGLIGTADFSYRDWRRAVRAGLGTFEQERNYVPGATRNRGPRSPNEWSSQLNRYSSEPKRRGRPS